MDRLKSIKLNGPVIRRILLAVYCITIGICVGFVMLRFYEPNQNALGAFSSVCMDIICIVILLVMISSFMFNNYESRKTTRLFGILLIATLWAIFLDFLNWAFDGSLEFGRLTYWFTVGSLCMGAILAGIFSLYLYFYMNETHNLNRMRSKALVCVALNIFSFVLTFFLAMTGTAFEFVDGHYEVGALYDVVTVIPVLTLLFLTAYAARYVKVIGIHDVVAVAGYILFMVFGALFEAQYRIGTTYVSVAIADIFIFVMLQNEIIAQEKRNVQVWMKKSKTDELTGLDNRHAYEADINALEEGIISDDFVFVSVDVNSLKSVNDSLGHSAGDELLVGASECLKKCFGTYGKLYRMGGDEFIALIYANERQLESLKKEIDEITANWSGELVQYLSISCGYATRREEEKVSIRQMAVIADRRMYEAKNEYYLRMGIDRRSGGDRRTGIDRRNN